jgi:hypothetical protein
MEKFGTPIWERCRLSDHHDERRARDATLADERALFMRQWPASVACYRLRLRLLRRVRRGEGREEAAGGKNEAKGKKAKAKAKKVRTGLCRQLKGKRF